MLPNAPLAELEDFARFAHMLADAADAVTLPMFRKPVAIDNKLAAIGEFDPVTLADQNAEKAIRALIEEHFPDHGILGEEFGHKKTNSPYEWILDPIDGTRAYITGVPLWGTLIALTFEGQAVFGLNSQPHIGERFWGYGRACLYQGPRETYGQLVTSQQTELSQALAATTAPELFTTKSDQAAFDIINQNVRLMRFGGDCYFYCLLAAGTIDLVLETGLNSYDIAALIPIVEGAGGIITNWQGEPIMFNSHKKTSVLACANKQLHQQALALINR
ncbi:MAG: histidinol-phosphatase [Rhizobiales bacterium]|nr:histidinol-phosphatase [Hyphomicrobiales bacterium]NRB14736.1 histidinol-phosphatase [Hyphomicrobiales bacterium]